MENNYLATSNSYRENTSFARKSIFFKHHCQIDWSAWICFYLLESELYEKNVFIYSLKICSEHLLVPVMTLSSTFSVNSQNKKSTMEEGWEYWYVQFAPFSSQRHEIYLNYELHNFYKISFNVIISNPTVFPLLVDLNLQRRFSVL